jgi:DNA-binding CsgD family transcriptional regulator
MIPLDHDHWQRLNQLALEIHAVGSRDELTELVTRSLPAALSAEVAWWSEHGQGKSRSRDHDTDSFQDEVLALLLARNAPAGRNSSACRSRPNRHHDAHDDIVDLSSLMSKRRRSPWVSGDPESKPAHHLVTQFFVDSHRHVLLTVRGSVPFTAEQKFTLAILREHLAIAARRHGQADFHSNPISSFPPESGLSRREMEVFPYLLKGFTNPEIADSLGISPRTVEKHVASILDKAGLDNRRMLIGLTTASTHGNPPNKNG